MNGVDKRYIDHAKVLKIQRLLQAGVSMRQVAEMVGVCFETVARYKAMADEWARKNSSEK